MTPPFSVEFPHLFQLIHCSLGMVTEKNNATSCFGCAGWRQTRFLCTVIPLGLFCCGRPDYTVQSVFSSEWYKKVVYLQFNGAKVAEIKSDFLFPSHLANSARIQPLSPLFKIQFSCHRVSWSAITLTEFVELYCYCFHFQKCLQ